MGYEPNPYFLSLRLVPILVRWMKAFTPGVYFYWGFVFLYFKISMNIVIGLSQKSLQKTFV